MVLLISSKLVRRLLALPVMIFMLLTATCLQLSAGSISQTVNFTGKNVTLQTVFDAVAKQTGYTVFYNYQLLKHAKKVTLDVKNASIEKVMEEALKEQELTFKIVEKTIIIKLKEKTDALPAEQPAVMRPVDIKGRIINENGEPVVASILVKGSGKGTTSNNEGFFELMEVDPNATLVVSGVSIETREIKINGQSNLTITVKISASEEGAVTINAGYYSVSNRERTGNISKTGYKTIERQPVSSPLQAIQGRMPGVYIQQSTGSPGGGFKIQIRGRNSLRTSSNSDVDGNLPLYLVDGVPFTSTSLTSPAASGTLLSGGGPLSAINPNDIASIEVLKDADATAIYGSRGSNGVILITTKSGKAGKTKVEANVYHGISRVAHFMEVLNTSQYITMRKEAFSNDNVIPDAGRAPDLMLWDTTRYTDWQKVMIGGSGHTTNAQLSISGGTERTQVALGAGYYRETSVFPGNSEFHRVSGRLSVNHQSENKKLNMQGSVNYSSAINTLPAIDLTGPATSLAPNAPALYDSTGKLNWENSSWNNPMADMEKKYKGVTDNLVANAMLGYMILPGLTLKSTFGYTTMRVNENTTNPMSSFDPAYLVYGLTASSLFANGNVKTWIVEPQADYSKKIGDGVLSVLVGATFQESVQKNESLMGDGYTNDAFLQNIQAATMITIMENEYSEYRYTAAFARVNYNWNSRYIFNLTGRRDGSSRFGPGKRFANFGAMGAAWIFSDENLIAEHMPFLSFGKLRASYGTTGSDAIGNYMFLETYSTTSYPYAGTGGLLLTRLGNPDYSWEINKKLEAGLELGFAKDRIQLSTSYYLNRSTDQLVGLPLPVITGQSSIQYNLPATVENRGWEIQLSTVNISKGKFRWSTEANITLPTNKLVAFPDLDKFPAYRNRYDLGKSVFTYKGYVFDGVNPQTGIYRYVDRNNDGSITNADYAGIKKLAQFFFGGIGNNLRYKNIQLDFFVQFVKQNGYDPGIYFFTPGTLGNQPAEVMNRWQKPGDNTNVQRFTATDPMGQLHPAYSLNVASDNLITDASFVRLKNVSLSWQLPLVWARNIGLNEMRIYLQGQNLFTITRYKGPDPETQSASLLPPLRVLTAGIQLSL